MFMGSVFFFFKLALEMLFTVQKERQLSIPRNLSPVLRNSLHLKNKRIKCCFSGLRINPNLEVLASLCDYHLHASYMEAFETRAFSLTCSFIYRAENIPETQDQRRVVLCSEKNKVEEEMGKDKPPFGRTLRVSVFGAT